MGQITPNDSPLSKWQCTVPLPSQYVKSGMDGPDVFHFDPLTIEINPQLLRNLLCDLSRSLRTCLKST